MWIETKDGALVNLGNAKRIYVKYDAPSWSCMADDVVIASFDDKGMCERVKFALCDYLVDGSWRWPPGTDEAN